MPTAGSQTLRGARVAVIGTGQMGPGIAACLALAGHEVCLCARSPASLERGLGAAREAMDLLRREGLATPRQSSDHLTGTVDLRAAVVETDFVFESIVEDLAEKRQLFTEVERLAPSGAIFASNTSGLPISRIADVLQHPSRAATTHFWNPPHLMPLVEIVKGERTSDETVARLRALLDGAGKQTVVVLKDVPGQLGNRLLHALFREAFHIVEEGIASVDDVDLAIRSGPGLRFPAYGLLEHADMIGLDMQLAIDSYLFAELSNMVEAPALLKDRVARGEMGARSGRGLYDWSSKDPAAVRARRDRFIIERLKERAKL
ncbi:MAG TPA: 3-hydroxyacyl-CoA dehydrogenase family protein [Ktedonobacterales bacterium]|nr:3-hydroxyacyl-CoA dehydrogenase family protein [Ktedonobacterales bacterium]